MAGHCGILAPLPGLDRHSPKQKCVNHFSKNLVSKLNWAHNGDIETASGIPAGTAALGQKILAADALVISTPEYNGSIPGVLKNVIDWLSREKTVSLTGKHLLLLAASPGRLGGVRSLWHSRQPFEVLGVHVFPGMMGLPDAYNAFDAQGRLKDPKTAEQLKKTLGQFIQHVQG